MTNSILFWLNFLISKVGQQIAKHKGSILPKNSNRNSVPRILTPINDHVIQTSFELLTWLHEIHYFLLNGSNIVTQ